MKAHVLKGSKEEIAEWLIQLTGVVREAIVFEDEPARPMSGIVAPVGGDMFAEMNAYMSDVPAADDSREAIYTKTDGE